MDIFKQLSSGADVDMAKPEYAEAIKEIAEASAFLLGEHAKFIQVPTCSLMEVLLRAYVQENIN